ncbi:MAG: MFS transporter [Prevotella sp.]|nr:MFS transporter [Prevotella sp.]MBQ7717481.1 MFS transporter [Prevotella sp.]
MKNKNPWTWVPSLYFAEGLPYVIVMTISVVMYKQLGLSNADITLYTSWLYLPWVIKPLWSPFVDVIKTKRWWITAMQLLVGAALGGVAFTIPSSSWLQFTLFFFWIMAFASATHDIAADGFYMLGLEEHDQAWFVGIRSTFYRLATIFGQGILVMIAGNIQVLFRYNIGYSWCLVFYGVCGLFIALWLWHGFILPRPQEDKGLEHLNASQLMSELKHTVVTFFTKLPKKEIAIAILFMLLYRMPEGLLAKVTPLFLLDSRTTGGLGLSPQEYGLVQGTVGVIGLTLGGILGGILAGRDGMKRWLWPMVCAITLPDVVYIYLSYAMPENLFLINACIFIEQFGYGFGFTAYMLYLIYFSQGPYKTSHYALCTAFMALSMMLPGMVSGKLQQMMGYQSFFILVMILCVVTFIVTYFIKVDPSFGKKKGE